MTTITQSLSTPPAAPDPATQTPTAFSITAAAFVVWQRVFALELQTWTTQTNTVAGEVNANAATVAANKSAVDSNTALVQAAASGGVWVSGTTYAIGDTRWAPSNGRVYRRKTAGAGTTDPASDGTNWLFISPIMRQVTEARATVAISSGVVALDLMNGITSVALNANVTSITMSNNIATATEVQCHTLEFVADGTARTVAWPNGNGTSTLLVKHVGGTAPMLTSTNGKRDTFFLKSVSQFLWDCYIVGQNT